jgi:hypothetical protein
LYSPPPAVKARLSPVALKFNAGQRIGFDARIVGRRDTNHDGGVGVAFVARILAHAVGDHAARLGGGGDHGAARAHAEAVGGTAVAAVVHQLVVGGTEQRVAGKFAEARAVDQGLRMFDAHTDRKRLGLDMHAALLQHAEAVAGAVADRQYNVAGGNGFAIRQAQRAQLAVCNLDILDARTEADFAAQRLDLGAHRLDHGHQLEGADVGFADVKDLGRGRRP